VKDFFSTIWNGGKKWKMATGKQSPWINQPIPEYKKSGPLWCFDV
jgi:hypothetical protein